MGTEITLKRPDGSNIRGYLTLAARGDAPGVVVLQEWWGLQDQVEGLCDRFAAAGFTALAPDLYGGKIVPYHDSDEAGKSMDALDFPDVADQSVQGAVEYLARNGSKVGVVGFCMGGAIAVLSAARVSGLSAAISYYGLPPAEVASGVKVPLLGHFASHDDWCSPAVVEKFERGLKSEHHFFRYEAHHAFANEQRLAVHDRQATELAWGRTVDFLSRHLSAKAKAV